MDNVKGEIKGWIILFLIATGVFGTIISFIFDVVLKAVCWVVFIDNAETGLSFYSETLVKGIVEAIILVIAGALGISKKNPLISIVSIVVGFVVCICIYFIKQYILWILIAILIFSVICIVYSVFSNKTERKIKTKLKQKKKN